MCNWLGKVNILADCAIPISLYEYEKAQKGKGYMWVLDDLPSSVDKTTNGATGLSPFLLYLIARVTVFVRWLHEVSQSCDGLLIIVGPC